MPADGFGTVETPEAPLTLRQSAEGDCRALLAKHPTWHVLIANNVKEKRHPQQEKRPHHKAKQSKPWQIQGDADDDRTLHKPVSKRPAAQNTLSTTLGPGTHAPKSFQCQNGSIITADGGALWPVGLGGSPVPFPVKWVN